MWILSLFFFLLLPSNLFTFLSSTYFSNLKFCVFLSLVLLNLSSSIFLNSQANYNRSEGKTLFHSFILYSLSHFGSFYSCLTCSSLKNISGQPETALHEEIFWGGNQKTCVRFKKPCGLTAVREVHNKNIISGFLCLKNRFKKWFSVNLVGPCGPVRVSKPISKCVGRFSCRFTWHTCTILNSHIFCWIPKIILAIVIEGSPILFTVSDTIFESYSNTASWMLTSMQKRYSLPKPSLLPQEVPKVGGNSCSLLLPLILHLKTIVFPNKKKTK